MARPKIPIKALGMYFTYDRKLLKEKNFIERLDSIKKLINIWSSRGLSVYGKVTIIKSFLIPKFVYAFSILPTPKESGGLKMIDVDCMIKSLRLAWLQRLFNDSTVTWKRYFLHLLEPVGGLFFLNCNYDIKEYNFPSQFYNELLLWWSEFRETFSSESDYRNIIWQNKEIRIDNKPVYFKNYLASGIINIHDLRFDLNITDSFSYFSNENYKINFPQWAGLRYSIPSHLKTNNVTVSTESPSFLIENNIFDVTVKRSKDYYSLLVTEKSKTTKYNI